MNKLVKRLLTGTLAFATILTALPVTAVHASGNKYWVYFCKILFKLQKDSTEYKAKSLILSHF